MIRKPDHLTKLAKERFQAASIIAAGIIIVLAFKLAFGIPA